MVKITQNLNSELKNILKQRTNDLNIIKNKIK